jgi:hypothetical protein
VFLSAFLFMVPLYIIYMHIDQECQNDHLEQCCATFLHSWHTKYCRRVMAAHQPHLAYCGGGRWMCYFPVPFWSCLSDYNTENENWDRAGNKINNYLAHYDYNYNERWKFRGTPGWPWRHTSVPRNTGCASLT